MRPLWQAAYEEGVDLVLTAHEHSYERFAPMDAEGELDDGGGMRLIVAGTGGGNLREFANDPLPTTEKRNDDSWGVLKLTLKPTGYDWEFLPCEGGASTPARARVAERPMSRYLITGSAGFLGSHRGAPRVG